jgi:predicted dehydrogenase
VLAAATETGTLLWEAFVFPFHAQFAAVQKLLADGAIGELLEIQSDFHFLVRNPANIRLARDLDGGALNDVGCYPVRIALELFGAGHTDAWATAVWGGHDVDVDTQGSLGFPDGRRLLLTCGMRRAYDTFTRLLGTAGQIQLTNPFHPGRGDSYSVLTDGEPPRTLDAGAAEPSFTGMIRHIQNVLRGGEAPRQLALDTSLASARALHDLHQSMGTAR